MDKKTFVIAVILPVLATFSCGKAEEDPLKTAISDKIKENNVQIETLDIDNLIVIDSVSLGDELDRRIALFKTKVRAENKMADVCYSKKAPAKAKEHLLKAEQAESIITGLEQWKNSPSKNMDSTLYYIASFYASGKCHDGSVLNPTPMKACFDACRNVYNVQNEKGNINTGMGVTIPGYREFLAGFRVGDE